jgi:hypothetical protein
MKLTMNKETYNRETATEELAMIIRQRTFNLMSTGRMMCSEAVLSVLNQGLGGGLPPDFAMKVASWIPGRYRQLGMHLRSTDRRRDIPGSFSFPKRFKPGSPPQGHGSIRSVTS